MSEMRRACSDSPKMFHHDTLQLSTQGKTNLAAVNRIQKGGPDDNHPQSNTVRYRKSSALAQDFLKLPISNIRFARSVVYRLHLELLIGNDCTKEGTQWI